MTLHHDADHNVLSWLVGARQLTAPAHDANSCAAAERAKLDKVTDAVVAEGA